MVLKIKLYNQCIIPTVTYVSEIWNLTKRQSHKRRTIQRAHERVMLNITWKDKNTAMWIRKQPGVNDINEDINMGWTYRQNGR